MLPRDQLLFLPCLPFRASDFCSFRNLQFSTNELQSYRPSRSESAGSYQTKQCRPIVKTVYASNHSTVFQVPCIPRISSEEEKRLLQRKYFWPTARRIIDELDDGDTKNLERFWEFTLYSTRKKKLPIPSHKLHKPSQEYFPNLPQPIPFHRPEAFPELLELRRNYAIIREELQQVLSATQGTARLKPHPTLSYLKGWRSLPLIDNGRVMRDTELSRILPKTLRLLSKVPRTPRGALFACQQPMTGIDRHSDGANFLLTAHLGLQIPDGDIWIEVGGEKEQWKEGDWLVLDTSFEHRTWNGTNSSRFVFVVDVWHPALKSIERAAILKLYELRGIFLEEWAQMEKVVDEEHSQRRRKKRHLFDRLFRQRV